MTEPLAIQLPPIYINQTRVRWHDECPRYYGWIDVEQLVPNRPRKQLNFGTSVHRAQVKIYQGNFAPEVIESATKEAVDTFRALMKPKDPIVAIPGANTGNDELQKEVEDGAAVLAQLLPAYYRHYADRGALWKPLGMELDFCVEVGEGTNVFLVGTLDNLAVFEGRLFIIDTKTMAKLDYREFSKYQSDIQLTAYLYGATKQLTLNARKENKPAVRVHGAIIDGMVKTKPPQFHREIFTRTIDQLREFEVEWCMKAWQLGQRYAMMRNDRAAFDAYGEQMFNTAAGNWKSAFPRNTGHCFKFGRPCDYYELCDKDNEVRRSLFRQKDPDYVDTARKENRRE